MFLVPVFINVLTRTHLKSNESNLRFRTSFICLFIYLFKIYFNIIIFAWLGLSGGLVPSRFLPNIWHVFLTDLMRATYSANITHILPSSLFAQVLLNKPGQIPNSYAVWFFYSCYVRIFSSHTHYNTAFCDLCVLALKFCSSVVTCLDRCLVVHDASLSGYAKTSTYKHGDWHQNCCNACGQKIH